MSLKVSVKNLTQIKNFIIKIRIKKKCKADVRSISNTWWFRLLTTKTSKTLWFVFLQRLGFWEIVDANSNSVWIHVMLHPLIQSPCAVGFRESLGSAGAGPSSAQPWTLTHTTLGQMVTSTLQQWADYRPQPKTTARTDTHARVCDICWSTMRSNGGWKWTGGAGLATVNQLI